MRDIIVNKSDIRLEDITLDTEGLIIAYAGSSPRFFIIYDGKGWIASMYLDIRVYSYMKPTLIELVHTLLELEFITSFKLVDL